MRAWRAAVVALTVLLQCTGAPRIRWQGSTPPTLSYGTYLGGSGFDSITAMTVTNSGDVYVAGWTDSSNFPTQSPLQAASGGGVDAFVAKFNSLGALVYSTYLGGNGDDRAWGIAVDSSGNAYVTGWTGSTNFPLANPLRATLAGGRDAFIAKLNAAGSALVYSTYLGGSAHDSGNAIAVDSSGNVYVAGDTYSLNFPTAGPYQSTNRGNQEVFIAKLNAAGSALLYSTYLGGAGDDRGASIAVDGSGNAYITGGATSTDFPTAAALRPSNAGYQDAFLTKLSAAGSSLVYSTYLGGSGGQLGQPEEGRAVAVDGSGNAYVAGVTSSANFPLAGAYQPTFRGGGTDAFVLKMNAAGNALTYSTYVGGSGIDAAYAIRAGSDAAPLVVGHTASPDFPVAEPLQSRSAGLYDAFVLKLNPAGNGLVFSTYFGGTGSDAAYAAGMNSLGDAYLAGQTLSTNLPTQNPFQATNGGGYGGFLAVISSTPPCGGVGPQGVVTTATSGTQDFYVYNVPSGSAVYFPAWSALYGQDDLVWYHGVDQGGGTWKGSLNLGWHRPGAPDYGEIAVQAWMFGPAIRYCGAATLVRTGPGLPSTTGVGPKEVSVPASAATVDFYAYGVTNATSVYFPTWSNVNGQDDLVWYPAADIGAGTWKATVNLTNHRPGNPDYGRYTVHVWLFGARNILGGEISFNRMQ